MSEVYIIHMRDARVGDTVIKFNSRDVKAGQVVKVDAAAKELTIRRFDAKVDEVFPWDSKRSRGYTKIKVMLDGDDDRAWSL
jgi:hypothetical protein